jgi:hypothetical protein
MTAKQRSSSAEQSARFREAAKKAEVDGKAFERAFKKVVRPKPNVKAHKTPP